MRRYIKSSFEIYISNIFVLGFNAIITLFLAYYLPKETFAGWVYGLTLFNILMVISLFGFQQATHHQIPRLRAKKSAAHLGEFIRLSRVSVLLTGVICMVVAGAIHLFHPLAMPEASVILIIFLICVPLWAHIRIRAETLRSYGATFGAILPDDGIKIAAYLLVPAFFFIMGSQAPGLLGIFLPLIAVAVPSLFILKWLEKKYDVKAHKTLTMNSKLLRKWLLFCMPFWLISALQISLQRIDLLILGQVGVFETVALYGLTLKIVQLVSFPAAAIATALAPDFSHMDEVKDKNLSLIIGLSSGSAILIGVIAALFIFTLAPFIFMLLGKNYVLDTTLLVILLGAEILWCAYIPVFTATLMTGSRRVALYSLVLGLALIITGNFWLAETMGALGTALTRLATFTLLIVILGLYMLINQLLGKNKSILEK